MQRTEIYIGNLATNIMRLCRIQICIYINKGCMVQRTINICRCSAPKYCWKTGITVYRGINKSAIPDQDFLKQPLFLELINQV